MHRRLVTGRRPWHVLVGTGAMAVAVGAVSLLATQPAAGSERAASSPRAPRDGSGVRLRQPHRRVLGRDRRVGSRTLHATR